MFITFPKKGIVGGLGIGEVIPIVRKCKCIGMRTTMKGLEILIVRLCQSLLRGM